MLSSSERRGNDSTGEGPRRGVCAMFVSPHFDDVAMSCGGIISRYVARSDRVLVVTVFTRGPRAKTDITPFAAGYTAACGLDRTATTKLWRLRRSEDAAAMTELGSIGRSLGYRDAIYRGPYNDVNTLFGHVRREDAPLIEKVHHDIVTLWRRTCPHAVVFLPLAIGRHVDHQICYQAGNALRGARARVWYYEDCPYAINVQAIEWRLREIGTPLSSMTIDISSHIERRISATRHYVTQLPLLFHGRMEVAMRSFAARYAFGSGLFGERIWTPSPNFPRPASRQSDDHLPEPPRQRLRVRQRATPRVS